MSSNVLLQSNNPHPHGRNATTMMTVIITKVQQQTYESKTCLQHTNREDMGHNTNVLHYI